MVYATFLTLILPTQAAVREWHSGVQQTHLLELYSSEGCSSCPPAERRLRDLRSDPGLWRTLVPVEFHVDYWNDLGWTDPYSQPAYSARQRAYAAAWRSDSVYTPCFALDGQEVRIPWTSMQQVGPSVGVLTATRTGDQTYVVRFVPATSVPSDVSLVGALLAGDVESQVRSGENRGRTLSHQFIVLNLQSKTAVQRKGVYEATLTLTSHPGLTARHVAFWVDANGRAIQAAGGNL